MEKQTPLATLTDATNIQELMLKIVYFATQPIMEKQICRVILTSIINTVVTVSTASTVDQLIRDLQTLPAIQKSATFDKSIGSYFHQNF